MSGKVMAVMDKPDNCENCVFGVCKYSTPLSTGRKGYYCNLKEPKDITIEDFFYADEVHLENCPLISKEEYDKEIRDKAIEEFAKILTDKIQFKYCRADLTRQYVGMQTCEWIKEIAEQMKEMGE